MNVKEILNKLNEAKDLLGHDDIPAELLPEFEKIAKDILLIDTLKTQYSDDKDFHDCAVWSIAQCMYEAYKLGQASKETELEDAFEDGKTWGNPNI